MSASKKREVKLQNSGGRKARSLVQPAVDSPQIHATQHGRPPERASHHAHRD